MAEAFYIRVPVDDLEQPHWRCLAAEDGGDGAIVLALRLRGLAAKCNHGGLIVRHTGEPMPLLQLSTYLGYTPQHLEHRLSLLAKHGLAKATQDDAVGGIRVVDPVLEVHLGRMNGAVQLAQLALPEPAIKKPNQRYSRPLTQAERQHLRRTGKLPEGVCRLDDMSRPSSRPNVTTDVTTNVTVTSQDNDFVRDSVCHVTDSSSSSSSSTSSSRDVMRDDDGYPDDLTPLMIGIPLHEQPRLLNKIRACLVAGHTVHACHQALDDAKKGATNGQPPWGLAHHKLAQLAAAPLPVKQGQEDEAAWQWWQGLAAEQQEAEEAEHHSRLLGVRGLTDRRKALILFRLRDEQREAA